MNNLLTRLAQWLGAQASPSQGAGWEAQVAPTWPWSPWWLVLLLALASGLAILLYRSERPTATRGQRGLLACLRISLFAILAFMLLGWMLEQSRTDLPDLVLVFDRSQSMGVVDAWDDSAPAAKIRALLAGAGIEEEAARWRLARALVSQRNAPLLETLAQRYRLKLFTIGHAAEPLETAEALGRLQPDAPSSRLGNALRDVLEAQRGRPTAAVVFFTDGVVTEGASLQDAAEYARRRAVPLFLVGLGNDRPRVDLRLAEVLADATAFVGDLVRFEVRVDGCDYRGPAVVRLRRQGETQLLAEEKLELGADGGLARLDLRAAEEGEFDFEVEVVPAPRETTLDNNKQTRRVVVRNERLRVLLVQGAPSYEFRFLKNALERELNPPGAAEGDRLGLRVVLQEADLEYVATDKTAEAAVPVSREELFAYDAVILSDVNPALLSRSVQEHLYEFVAQRGGGMAIISGPRHLPAGYRDSPLAALFPAPLEALQAPPPEAVVSESFRPLLTPLGRISPQLQLAESSAANLDLWTQKLPPWRWLVRLSNIRPGVRTLVEHPTLRTADGQAAPLITLQYIGAGKVIFHASDETYRWRFRAGDLYFARYWVQTLRFLSRGKLLGENQGVELSTDRETYQAGDLVRIRARFLDDRQAPAADDGAAVILERAGARRKPLRLERDAVSRGRFEATLSDLPAGDYRLWLTAPQVAGQPPSTQFRIEAPAGELADTLLRAADLRAAAKLAGGKYYDLTTAAGLAADLPPGRQTAIAALPPIPLWNYWPLAALFVALLTSEWLLRKRWGLT